MTYLIDFIVNNNFTNCNQHIGIYTFAFAIHIRLIPNKHNSKLKITCFYLHYQNSPSYFSQSTIG